MIQPSLDERVSAEFARLRPAERNVARFFQDHREDVLIASASAIAERTGSSDATVIRTAKALGFAGMKALRNSLAAELRDELSPAGRLARTLDEVGDDLAAALDVTLKVHEASLQRLRRDVTPALFRAAVDRLVEARRVCVFGIGPSSAMVDYLVIQLERFGLEVRSLTHAGSLLADGLLGVTEGDLLVLFAYSRVYRELAAVLHHAERRGAETILITDTLAAALRQRVDLVLPVARGRTDMLSMHTATLGLIEALLLGVATARPQKTLASLDLLNALRAELVGEPPDLT